MPQNMKNVSSHGSGDQESGLKVLEGSVHPGLFTSVPLASCHYMGESEASEHSTVVNQPYVLLFFLVPACSYFLPNSAIVGFTQTVTHETQGANSLESTQLSLCL